MGTPPLRLGDPAATIAGVLPCAPASRPVLLIASAKVHDEFDICNSRDIASAVDVLDHVALLQVQITKLMMAVSELMMALAVVVLASRVITSESHSQVPCPSR